MVHIPRDYKPPSFRSGGKSWDLDEGTYLLTARPVKPGILEIAVRHSRFLDPVWDLLKEEKVREKPVRPAVRFPQVALDYNRKYTMHLNRQPGVRSGVIVRALPLDLGIGQSDQGTR